MQPVTEFQESSGISRPRPLFGPIWPGLLIAAALVVLSVVAPFFGMGIASVAAGMGIWCTIELLRHINQSSKEDAILFQYAEDLTFRIRTFLIRNPVLLTSETVRRALVPTDEELATVAFHHTFKKRLRDLREGRYPTIGEGQLEREFCMKPAGHDDWVQQLFQESTKDGPKSGPKETPRCSQQSSSPSSSSVSSRS